MTIKHRVDRRVSVSQLIMQMQGVSAAGPFYGIVSNLSPSGCFFLTYAEVQMHEVVRAQILLPTERWLQIKGEVLHQAERIGFGIRLLNLTGEDRAILELTVDYAHGLSFNADSSTDFTPPNEPAGGGLRPAERRKHPRSETDPGRKPNISASGIENVSMGGLFLRTSTPVSVGTALSLRIPLGVAEPLFVRVEVIHVRPGSGFGARFLWPGEDDPSRMMLAREMTLRAGIVS